MIFSSPLGQLFQLTTEVLVVEEFAWKAFEGIVAGSHVKAGAECDNTLQAVILIVTEVLGEDAPAEDSQRASLSLTQNAVMHTQSIMVTVTESIIHSNSNSINYTVQCIVK